MSSFAPLCSLLLPLLALAPAVSEEAPAIVAAGSAPAGFSRDDASAASLEHLSALIRIDTTNSQSPEPGSSRPNGNELATARYFADVLADLQGVETHVLEVEGHPGRANFVARLRAERAVAPPVLVMGHMDVVGADPSAWGTDPFEPTVVDGYLYGRGAIDCKGPLAAELTAFIALAKTRGALTRDVVLLATAAEEGGPSVGIDWVLEHRRNLLGDPEFALNEGGRIRLEGDRVVSVNVQTTEKVPYNVIATATGPSGHGSVPLPDNALAALARACARVHEWRAPAAINATTGAFFWRTARIESDPLVRGAMLVVGGEDQGPAAFQAAVDLLSEDPAYNAVLRAGASLTILDGGFRTNVIPSTGTATFNLRVLPGDDVLALVDAMQEAGGEPSVSFALSGEPRVAPPPSPLDTALFEAMESAAKAMAPGVEVIPFMSTGATDGAALRAIAIPTYGILPIPLRMEDELRMHGDDERAPVSGLGWAAEYVYRVLQTVAG